MTALSVTRVGLWRRTLCLVYESLIVFSLLVFFGYAYSALAQFHGAPGLVRTLFQLWLVLVLAAYFGWCWSRGRRTLPMKTLALRVVDHQGQPLTPARALMRYLMALICLLAPLGLAHTFHPAWLALLVLPAVSVLIDPHGRTPYDWLSGTRLIRAG